MTTNPIPGVPPASALWVTLRVKGILQQEQWAGWFEDMEMKVLKEPGETLLSGWVADQAGLYGTLTRLRNLGLALLALETRPPGEEE